MARPIPPACFALKSWTIKQQGEKFVIAPTASFDDKTRWSKPYASLQAATSAIARKLAEEWREREERRRNFHGLKKDAVR
jgi:hypothetical protein